MPYPPRTTVLPPPNGRYAKPNLGAKGHFDPLAGITPSAIPVEAVARWRDAIRLQRLFRHSTVRRAVFWSSIQNILSFVSVGTLR